MVLRISHLRNEIRQLLFQFVFVHQTDQKRSLLKVAFKGMVTLPKGMIDATDKRNNKLF